MTARISFLVGLCILVSTAVGFGETITIATFEWCPYICPNDPALPGLLVEYTRAIFARSGETVEFIPYPWTRAINSAKSGSVDAVLGPAKNEVPSLIYPPTEIGEQRFCFFKLQRDPWMYDTPESVAGRSIVYPQDALPEELIPVKDQAARCDPRAYNEGYVVGTTKQLLADRYNTVLMTDYTMLEYLRQNHLADQIVSAGCVSSQKVYLAFTPDPKKQARVKILIDVFEQDITQLQKDHYFESLLAKYGLD